MSNTSKRVSRCLYHLGFSEDNVAVAVRRLVHLRGGQHEENLLFLVSELALDTSY